MEIRNITLTLDKAREWHDSGNEALKEAALQAFSREELGEFDFRKIKTFSDALKTLYCRDKIANIGRIIKDLNKVSRASAAMFELNIIKKALNKNYDVSFTKEYIWYPFNPIITSGNTYYTEQLIDGTMRIIGNLVIECRAYSLLGGLAHYGDYTGLGCFFSSGVGAAPANLGFLGCATKEIAEHFSRYFGKIIFDAKYGDTVNYKWI